MITIEKGKIKDMRKIKLLEERVWEENNVFGRYAISVFIRFGYVFVAKDDGAIIGVVHAIGTKKDEVYITDLFVDRRYHSQGVATKLYKRLIEAANGKPVISFVQVHNESSLRVHEKLGFRIVKKLRGVNDISPNSACYLMKLE
jgi:ribosomal protein S18 acetylase RimI-like enzyme